MSSSKESFVLMFRDRRVLALAEQCPHYSDIIALAKATFASLQHTAAEDIVIMGNGKDCPWFSYVELPERAWETFYSQVDHVIVAFKRERVQTEQPIEKVESKLESKSE